MGSQYYINCSNNYGPYQFPEKLLPLFINNVMNNRPLLFMAMVIIQETGFM